MTPMELIARKRDGAEHTPDELSALVRMATDGSMADYQLSAWLMAVTLRGMTPAEAAALAMAMRDSGRVVAPEELPQPSVDKHSTGGVGDKTTLVVAPLLASAGACVLKMSGRGLGHTGGTIDKLESISGMRTELRLDDALAQVRRIGLAIVSQTPELAPADGRLYALRDVTATVGSIPLIAASIMSKKLAAGARTVLLDVKMGRGALLTTLDDSRELARLMVGIGRAAGVLTEAAITPMDEPLGMSVGNALEVAEAIRVLTGRGEVDSRFRELCLLLAAHALAAAGLAPSPIEAYRLAEGRLATGGAAEAFQSLVEAQGGDPRVLDNPDRLPSARIVRCVRAQQDGYIEAVDALAIAEAAAAVGASRRRKGDAIDHAAGVVLHARRGDPVSHGDPLADLHVRREADGDAVSAGVREAFRIAHVPPPARAAILEVVR
ncbi:MAG TPA: thymidine phosphorylase [Chthonomonadales bacterium]|nr:thymidine phosphorylase [Chthonomonadales bacterium]